MTLVRNAAACLDCDAEIESQHRHDFVQCRCGNIFVDGGLEYVRRGWHNDNWVELSEYEDETAKVDNGSSKW